MLKNKRKYYRIASWRPARHRWAWQRSTRTASEINRRSVSRAVLTIFFTASLIWFVYFFLASDNFVVKTVNIVGLSNIPESDLRQIVKRQLAERRWLVFRNSNLILFSKQALQKRIAEKYVVQSVAIDRDWPFTININVQEKSAQILLRALVEAPAAASAATSTAEQAVQSEPEYYYMDVNGIIVAPAGNIGENELGSLPVVEVTLGHQTLVNPGQTILKRELVEYALAVYEAVGQSSANIKVSYIMANSKTEDEAVFVTSEGWQASLSRKLPLDTQIKKLELALREKIGDKRKTLQYVDLRVKDRVYYK